MVVIEIQMVKTDKEEDMMIDMNDRYDDRYDDRHNDNEYDDTYANVLRKNDKKLQYQC